jgi:hypothetical protein
LAFVGFVDVAQFQHGIILPRRQTFNLAARNIGKIYGNEKEENQSKKRIGVG